MTLEELAKQYEESAKTAKTEEEKQLNQEIAEYLSHYFADGKMEVSE